LKATPSAEAPSLPAVEVSCNHGEAEILFPILD
jgi:hypothetical protein